MEKKSNLSRIVKGSNESARAEFAEKRIMKALEIAKMNAEEELVIAQEKKATFVMGSKSAEQVVSSLAEIINDIKTAEETIETLNGVEKFLTDSAEDSSEDKTDDEEDAPKKRGRKKGSKNTKKAEKTEEQTEA